MNVSGRTDLELVHVERDGDRDLRFRGRLRGSASSTYQNVIEEVKVWSTHAGHIVVQHTKTVRGSELTSSVALVGGERDDLVQRVLRTDWGSLGKMALNNAGIDTVEEIP